MKRLIPLLLALFLLCQPAQAFFSSGTFPQGFSRPASSFVPSAYGTVALEADPSQGITLGTGVSQWVAKQGSFTGAQATGSKQPAYTAADSAYNNKPTLSFTAAASQELEGSAPNLGNQWTIFVVGESTSTGGSALFNYYNTAAGINTGIRAFQEANFTFSGQDSAAVRDIAVSGTLGRGIFVLRADANSLDAFFNGSPVGTPATWNGTSYAALDKLEIGSLGTFYFLEGKIAYILAYQGALSDVNVAAVTAALNARFAQY